MKTIPLTLLMTAALATPLPEPTPTPEYVSSIHPINTPRPSRTAWRIPPKWRALAQCESRMRSHANRHNTYYGLWQIHKGWFKPFGIDPATATIYQQYQVAQHIYAKQGAKAWTCAKHTNFK